VRYASLSSGGTDTIARIAGDGHKGSGGAAPLLRPGDVCKPTSYSRRAGADNHAGPARQPVQGALRSVAS
jgi:hypothetical protein